MIGQPVIGRLQVIAKHITTIVNVYTLTGERAVEAPVDHVVPPVPSDRLARFWDVDLKTGRFRELLEAVAGC